MLFLNVSFGAFCFFFIKQQGLDFIFVSSVLPFFFCNSMLTCQSSRNKNWFGDADLFAFKILCVLNKSELSSDEAQTLKAPVRFER